jgi:HPt (histidine-containing phosphotransfer) domain-containing protein
MAKIDELQELDQGSGFFAELVREFNAQNQRLIENLRAGALDCDFDQLRFNAHTLKGSSLNIGALRQAKIARRVEDVSAAEDCATVNQCMPLLEAVAEETQAALRSLV